MSLWVSSGRWELMPLMQRSQSAVYTVSAVLLYRFR